MREASDTKYGMNCALGHAIKVGINVISGLFGHLASDGVEDISLYQDEI